MTEEDVIHLVKTLFPLWLEGIKTMPRNERGPKYQHVLEKAEICLAVGWDDLPDCKKDLENIIAQIKEEQRSLLSTMN